MNDLGSWISDHAWAAWIGAAVILSIVELLSLDLVLLMFAIAALLAAVVSALGVPVWIAVPVFALASIGLLGFARPSIVARLHDGPTLRSGHQALIGRTAVVVEPVTWQGGRVELASEIWSARTPSQDISFEAGTDVLVAQIDGATAIVTRKAM